MYKKTDIEKAGKHDYDKEAILKVSETFYETFSVNIFKWELKKNGKELKHGKCIVRVKAKITVDKEQLCRYCEYIVYRLDNGEWSGYKSVTFTNNKIK